MIGYGFYPVFVAVIKVTALHFGTCTSGVEADEFHEIFVIVIESRRIGYEFDVAFEEGHGIEQLHFFALLPFDVLFGVGKPRPHGSRCGNGETNTVFEVAPIASRGAIEGIGGHSKGSVVDGDLWVLVVGSGLFTQFQLGFGSVTNCTTQLGFIRHNGLCGKTWLGCFYGLAMCAKTDNNKNPIIVMTLKIDRCHGVRSVKNSVQKSFFDLIIGTMYSTTVGMTNRHRRAARGKSANMVKLS